MARFPPLAQDRASQSLLVAQYAVAALGDCIVLYISRNETEPYLHYSSGRLCRNDSG
jgi:hypothetical protein